MPEEKLSKHKEVARNESRDESGHFIHRVDPGSNIPIAESQNQQPHSPQNPISKFFSDHSHYDKSQDDLVDLHIGNPLRRISQLLEDIKRQKAFSFTLKGSLGLAGVALALGVFGIFGGGQILCDKGTQVEIGTIKQLQILQEDPTDGIPVLSQFVDYFQPKQSRPKFVLIKSDQSIIQLPYSRNVDLAKFANYRVIATGNYNACSQTLTIKDPGGIEMY